jgi:ATP-dependent RNA helicase RhlE
VVNFDVPNLSEDYIHRVGRTARAQNTGEAWTFFAPDEEQHVRTIERAVRSPLPRITVDGFDYSATGEAAEVPLKDRMAALRTRRREERSRGAARRSRSSEGQDAGAGRRDGSSRPPRRGGRSGNRA